MKQTPERKYQIVRTYIHQTAKETLGYNDENKKVNPEWWKNQIGQVEAGWLRTHAPED